MNKRNDDFMGKIGVNDMEGKYGVAYLDIDGEGFSDTEPFIVDCATERLCIETVEDLLSEGYSKVAPFKYSAQRDYYDWNYIEKNRIVI